MITGKIKISETLVVHLDREVHKCEITAEYAEENTEIYNRKGVEIYNGTLAKPRSNLIIRVNVLDRSSR